MNISKKIQAFDKYSDLYNEYGKDHPKTVRAYREFKKVDDEYYRNHPSQKRQEEGKKALIHGY